MLSKAPVPIAFHDHKSMLVRNCCLLKMNTPGHILIWKLDTGDQKSLKLVILQEDEEEGDYYASTFSYLVF
jgi:hypothetical protein